MGKYMKKTKADGVLEVMHSSLGVRTRAKTLALQRLSEEEGGSGSGSYLQLRNRRLEKLQVLHHSSKRLKQVPVSEEKSAGVKPKVFSGSDGAVEKIEDRNDNGDVGIEACFGENVLEVEGTQRGTRESTPCNLIRDPDIIRTPGSTNRPSVLTGTGRSVQNSVHQNIQLASELDELFTDAEKEQQKSFTEKYNFDPTTDKPLLGRFEWEKMGIKK